LFPLLRFLSIRKARHAHFGDVLVDKDHSMIRTSHWRARPSPILNHVWWRSSS